MAILDIKLFEAIKAHDQQQLTQLYSPDIDKKQQSSLLTFALGVDNREAVTFLVDKITDLNLPDELNQLPIFVAIDTLQFQYVELLIQKGVLDITADIFSNLIRDEVKNTIYHTVFFANFKHQKVYNNAKNISKDLTEVTLQILQIILEKGKSKGFSLDIQNKFGATALHYAAASTESKVLDLLLSYNPQLNIKDNEGKIPLDYALETQNFSSAITLITKASSVGKITFKIDNNTCITKSAVKSEQIKKTLQQSNSSIKELNFTKIAQNSLQHFIFNDAEAQALHNYADEIAQKLELNSSFTTEASTLNQSEVSENNEPTLNSELSQNISTNKINEQQLPLEKWPKFFSNKQRLFILLGYTLLIKKIIAAFYLFHKHTLPILKKIAPNLQSKFLFLRYKLAQVFIPTWIVVTALYKRAVANTLKHIPHAVETLKVETLPISIRKFRH